MVCSLLIIQNEKFKFMAVLKSEKKVLRIALDAMGGDFAPINEVQGAIQVFDDGELDVDFEARRKGSRRRTVRRVSARKPKGQRVYSKSGKARIGRWIRV